LRFAEPEDAERIAEVINLAFRQAEEFFIDSDRIDAATVLNLLDTGTFLLAERKHLLEGSVYIERREHSRAYLGLLAVAPVSQQSGVGSLLMRGAEDYCRGLGLGFIDIKIVNLRKELTGFYGRRGYLEIGTSPFPSDVQTKLAVHFIDMSKPLTS
jgi:GNAT superfamily N-acetyltransferase